MKFRILARIFAEDVRRRMKYNDYRFFGAIWDTFNMAFLIMGIKLYYKYMTGIAVEGVDF